MKLKDYIHSHEINPGDQICAHNYLSLCSEGFWPQTDTTFSYIVGDLPRTKFDKDATIFLKTRELGEIVRKCGAGNNKFKLVCSLGDDVLTEEILKELPASITKIYTRDAVLTHPKVVPIPLGTSFRNPYQEEARGNLNTRLLYSNFALNTNKERPRVHSMFKNKPWCTTRVVERWLKYPITGRECHREMYMHKYVLSPEGNGIDCFRTWEALYLKSIPIVNISDAMLNFKDLPILFTEDYSEITENYLERTYAEMLETDYDLEKLHFSYWKKVIEGSG